MGRRGRGGRYGGRKEGGFRGESLGRHLPREIGRREDLIKGRVIVSPKPVGHFPSQFLHGNRVSI